MTVLITEDPGRSIDVYLRPLVDELKDLWTNGVRTYDKATGKMFTLRAAVMWTVNDFPTYAMVSEWSTKDGCHEITSGGKMIKSLTGTQSITSDLENGPVMRSWNS
ncbi:unnamed protein product [Prunus armeniaca]